MFLNMTKHAAIVVLWMSAALTGALIAEEAADLNAPGEVLVSYEAALKKGDVKTAKDLTAKFKTIPDEALEQFTAKYAEGAKAGELSFKLVKGSVKIIGDFAVVTFADGVKERPDYDPAYLMRQDGKWKVFLGLTQWNRPRFDLSAEQKKQLAELEVWFDAESERLYGR